MKKWLPFIWFVGSWMVGAFLIRHYVEAKNDAMLVFGMWVHVVCGLGKFYLEERYG